MDSSSRCWTPAASLAVVFCCLSLCQTVPQPQAQETPPAHPELAVGNKILIIYDEQKISDKDRARLYALVARSVPPQNWPKVKGSRLKSLWKIIDDFLDFFPTRRDADAPASPETSRFLVDEVMRVNNLETDALGEDTELMIPPVPVRGYARYDNAEPKPQIRTYRPENQGYANTNSFSDLTFSDSPRVELAEDLGLEREGKLTVIEVDLSGLSPEQARAIRERGPSDAYLILPDSGYLLLQLLEQGSPCNDAEQWMQGSPYLPLLMQKLALYTREKKNELVAKAKAMPLMIVDWGLDPATEGHGSKVLSAARYLLRSLGAGDVDFLADSIIPMDLYPGSPAQRDRLLRLLDRYHDHLSRDNRFFRSDPLASVFRDAEDWVRNARPDPAADQHLVPEILIKAAFWELSERRAWVNMSFTVHSPTFKIEDPRFVRENRSFASLAAGNSRLALPPGTAPQEASSHALNLVNVTYGDSRGSISGTFSDLERNTVVSLVGPGCGYAFGSLSPDDSGSSFASPYVAAAAWLKYLLDGTDVKAMRRNLILASRPLPRLEQPIESGGIFDPARLLASPGPHFVDINNSVVRLHKAELEATYETKDGERLPAGGQTRSDTPRTLVVYRENSQFRFWLRTVKSTGFPDVDIAAGKLLRLRLTLVKEDGERLQINTPEQFVAQIQELSF